MAKAKRSAPRRSRRRSKEDGDSIMLRALIRTLVPTRRDRTVEFDLPKIETPNETTEIMALLSTHVRRIAIVELEERIAVLERKQVKGRLWLQRSGYACSRRSRSSSVT
jgi:hypothetical protein